MVPARIASPGMHEGTDEFTLFLEGAMPVDGTICTCDDTATGRAALISMRILISLGRLMANIGAGVRDVVVPWVTLEEAQNAQTQQGFSQKKQRYV